jgi:hypothetical protein
MVAPDCVAGHLRLAWRGLYLLRGTTPPTPRPCKIIGGSALAEMQWRPFCDVDRSRLREARLQAHYAVQWLARAARAYVAPQPDDSHTSLRWDNDFDCFMTRPLRDHSRLSLQIKSLTLAVHSRDSADAQSLPLSGCTEAEVRRWLGERLAARGLDAQALDAPSPYEMPEHAIARGAAYAANGIADALGEIAACFANAAFFLDRIQRQMIEHKFSASPVRCWPHHFDLATLTMLPMPDPDMTGYVGTGVSPGDEYYDEPYFYVSVYPEPEPAALPALPALGHWHTHHFAAAILPAHKILTVTDQAAATGDFLDRAIAIALKLLM